MDIMCNFQVNNPIHPVVINFWFDTTNGPKLLSLTIEGSKPMNHDCLVVIADQRGLETYEPCLFSCYRRPTRAQNL